MAPRGGTRPTDAHVCPCRPRALTRRLMYRLFIQPGTRSWWRQGARRVVCLLPGLLLSYHAEATFHTWKINEVYSSPDGSVQFVELHESLGFNSQELLATHFIRCINGTLTNTFIFPTNLPSSITANKYFVVGTANLATVPGGVVPDYVLTNAVPFLFAGSGTIEYAGVDTVTYANLPADGVASLVRSGASMVLAPTNSLINFGDATNSIVPVRFSSVAQSETNLVLSIPTATGPNVTEGPQYEVQTNSTLGTTNWGSVTNLTGDGTVQTATIPNSAPSLFFRLSVP